MLNYSRVPVPYMVDGIRNYVEHGRPPGSFLTALLCNDFMEACRKADDNNRAALWQWSSFFYNEMPVGSFGSPEAYQQWLERVGGR